MTIKGKRTAFAEGVLKYGRSNFDGLKLAEALAGSGHMKRHSDGETPWQYGIGDYEVRFSDKTPRGTDRRDGGSWGIYLRDYNVRVATFADNSAFLRNALARMFDAAFALTNSEKIRDKEKRKHKR